MAPNASRCWASVTTTKCQPWLLLPVGAWVASSRHSLISSGSTGREKSRRLRTERVVDSSSSGERFSIDMYAFLLRLKMLYYGIMVYCSTSGFPEGPNFLLRYLVSFRERNQKSVSLW